MLGIACWALFTAACGGIWQKYLIAIVLSIAFDFKVMWFVSHDWFDIREGRSSCVCSRPKQMNGWDTRLGNPVNLQEEYFTMDDK